MSKTIDDITLVIIDCVDDTRCQNALKKCLEQIQFKNILYLTSLSSSSPYVVKIDKISSREDYSRFVCKDLYKFLNTSHCLIVQHDGWVVDGSKWENSFLDYDYIGCNTIWTSPGKNGKGGNGGFSLRSKKLLEFSAKHGHNGCHPEDMHYSCWEREFYENAGYTFATREVQNKFGFEMTVWSGQFGHHQCTFNKNFSSTISIDKIYYGTSDKYIECTDLLKNELKEGFVIDNAHLDALVGDPFFGVSKSLYVYGVKYPDKSIIRGRVYMR